MISTNGAATAVFQYDGMGRRMTKTVSGASTSFLYDGLNVVQELAGASPTANLLTGLSIDEIFSRIDASGSRSFIADGLGSTLALLDSVGVIQTQYTYEPFGKTVVTGSSSGNPFQYTGRENDNAGAYYYRARYYSPSLQRFISEDPLGFAGGDVNLAGFVGDNPTNYVDPLGLSTPPVHFVETFFSEWMVGRGVLNSLIAATGSMMPDIFRGTSSAQTNLHAMSGRKPNDHQQTPEQAKEGARKTIERLLETGRNSGSEITNSLARGWAHHVVQDSWAHRYGQWPIGLPDQDHFRNDLRDFNHLYLNDIDKPCHGLF